MSSAEWRPFWCGLNLLLAATNDPASVTRITYGTIASAAVTCRYQPGSIIFGCNPYWRHQMETFSVLLDFCAGNSPVTGEFPAQRPVTRSFDVFFDLHPNKRLSKQPWGWWLEKPSSQLWPHCNDYPLHRPCVDDVMTRKRFPHYWPFMREFPATGGFPSKRGSIPCCEQTVQECVSSFRCLNAHGITL